MKTRLELRKYDKMFRDNFGKDDYTDTIYVPCKYISGIEGQITIQEIILMI